MSTVVILSVGTQVVMRVAAQGPNGAVPSGAVGVIVKAPVDPEHSYRVRFPDGVEVSFRREDFGVRKEHQREGLEGAEAEASEPDLREHAIFRCVVGSRAYGLEHEGSDTDRRGIFLPPAERHWSLFGVPEQVELDATQEVYWELQKFLVLALKANPNVLECLYSPIIELRSEVADELLAMREAFLSRLIYQTYNGYVMSQFRKLEQDLRARGEIKWKHAMHLIRLLLSGVTALRDGVVPVRVEAHRDRLLAIRSGALPWEEIEGWRLSLHKEFEAAFAATRLPERPDYARANALLVRARKSMVR